MSVPQYFAAFMVALAEAYPSVMLREGTVRVYYSSLSDVPPDDLSRAMQQAVKHSKFFPSVAELRSYVQTPLEDAAVLAWTGLLRAVRQVGAYSSLTVEDPATAAAVRLVFGSWPAVCELEEGPVLAQRRSEFLAAYRDARRRQAVPTGDQRLQGLCEASGRYLRGRQVHVGYLTADGVTGTRLDLPQLPGGGDGTVPAGLTEGADAQAAQGPAGPGGAGGGKQGPGGVR